jgi:IS5 family transposase
MENVENQFRSRSNRSLIAVQVWFFVGWQADGICDFEKTTAKKQTKRVKFLSEMDQVVPWQALTDLIESFYPKTGSKGGRPPYPLATMLRIHLMQQLTSLSDPAMEDVLIEGPIMRRLRGST